MLLLRTRVLPKPPIPPLQVFATKDQRVHVPKVRLLTIWFGANDACIKPSPQHVPLPKFTANLKHLISLVTSPTSPYYSPDTKILLITPPPVNTLQRGADLRSRDPPKELDREFKVTEAYAQAVRDVGREVGVPVVDVFQAIWSAAGQKEEELAKFLGDGLHLNGAGYEVRTSSIAVWVRGKKY